MTCIFSSAFSKQQKRRVRGDPGIVLIIINIIIIISNNFR